MTATKKRSAKKATVTRAKKPARKPAKKSAKKSAKTSVKRIAGKVTGKIAKKAARKSTAKKSGARKSARKATARKSIPKTSPKKTAAKTSTAGKSARKRPADDDALGCGLHDATEQAEWQSNPSVDPGMRKRAARVGALSTTDGKPSVGLTQVPADKMKDGYSTAWIRADLKQEYIDALQTIRALGGVMTSSGAIRDLGAGAGPGRSKTSFHYSGRAFDLWIGTGMSGATDRYMIQRAGGTNDSPEWEILCVSENPLLNDMHYDASLIQHGTVKYVVWKKGTGYVEAQREATYFSLSAVLRKFGWVNIPARADWKTVYLSCEWWHFQHHKGLKEGVSKFGDELRAVWPSAKVAASGLALDAVFKGRSFRA